MKHTNNRNHMNYFYTDFIREKILASPFDTKYLKGEIQELKDELKILNLSEAYNEWEDVAAVGTIILAQRTGWNILILPGLGRGAVKRWHERISIWKRMVCQKL